MSFTTSEKLRIELSCEASHAYRKTKNWTRAYEVARRKLTQILREECQTVLVELDLNEDGFIKSEFFS